MSPSSKDIDKVGLLVIDEGRILLCRKRRGTPLLILPGGKREAGETDVECLLREIAEELGDVRVEALERVGEYRDRAAGEDERYVRIALYQGNLNGEPAAQSEIAELVWFGAADDRAQLAPSIARRILPDLLARGILRW
jgi:8-oxo-dGTP pyrophosphatase MutT (NUDIX family)